MYFLAILVDSVSTSDTRTILVVIFQVNLGLSVAFLILVDDISIRLIGVIQLHLKQGVG